MANTLPMTLRVYRKLSFAIVPLAPAVIKRRLKLGKEDPARIGERRGMSRDVRPKDRWCGSTAPASARCWPPQR
jgi:3-deoxy-D-manno-octulosonic-acid transferase